MLHNFMELPNQTIISHSKLSQTNILKPKVM
jgi:hypothetical protein